jgi:N-methylhydantoinase B
VVRRYAVVLDWDSGALLPVSTGQFREMFHKRTAAAWAKGDGAKTSASSGV